VLPLRLPTSAPPWPKLYLFPNDPHCLCHLPLPPRAKLSPERTVSVVHTLTDRKSLPLASPSTRFQRSMAQMMAFTPIWLLGQKLMVALRRSHMCVPRRRVNASTRSRVLPHGLDDLRVSAMRLVRALRCFEVKCSLTPLTSPRTSPRAASNERGFALWCAPRVEYGSIQLPCRGDARNVGRKEASRSGDRPRRWYVAIILFSIPSCVLIDIRVHSRVRQSPPET
jgi:hypothetical protein